MPLTEEGRTEIRTVLKRQHGGIVKRIEDILNGQNVRLDDIPR